MSQYLFDKMVQELLDMADKALAKHEMPRSEHQFCYDLAVAIERQKIENNNTQAMKGLDRHFEFRGGCERSEYDS